MIRGSRHGRHGRHRRAGGFTLIEMVMVIGIIVLLAALTITVGSGLRERSEIGETESRLKILTSALDAWELARDRKVTYGIDGEPSNMHKYEIQQDTLNEEEVTLKLMAIISRPRDVSEILARIRSEFIEEDEFNDPDLGVMKTYIIKDAWDEPILAIHPGRTWVTGDGYTRDADGTIRTPLELVYGIATNAQIYFVSAGPDGEFGALNGTAQELEEADDNIYSYEVIRP